MISSPHPKRHFELGVTAAISGMTTHIKDSLKEKGFRWNNARRNWYKFGDSYEALQAECLEIWGSNPGKILFEVFEWNREKTKNACNGIPF